jgi:hypothetical protein
MLLPALEAELVLDGCGRHWGGAMIVRQAHQSGVGHEPPALSVVRLLTGVERRRHGLPVSVANDPAETLGLTSV